MVWIVLKDLLRLSTVFMWSRKTFRDRPKSDADAQTNPDSLRIFTRLDANFYWRGRWLIYSVRYNLIALARSGRPYMLSFDIMTKIPDRIPKENF